MPTPPPPVTIPEPDPEPEPEPDAQPRNEPDQPRRWVKTKPNAHGVYKVYPTRPTHDPDNSVKLEHLCDTDDLLALDHDPTTPPNPWFFPFKNPTIAHIMIWQNLTDNHGSDAGTDAVVHAFRMPDSKAEDLTGFNAATENRRLDTFVDTPPGEPPNGWKRGSVKLKLPCVGHRVKEEDAPVIEIENIYYRPLLDTLKQAMQSPTFQNFHLTPYELRWDPGYNPNTLPVDTDNESVELDERGLPPLSPGHQQLFGEVYTSPRMLKAHYAFEKLPPSQVERVRVPCMFFSDATHLASFGNASIWPLYTYFGNFSKYLRVKPSFDLAYHQAYFPSVIYHFFNAPLSPN
ncbi:hypothetical protein GGX14DRAFT_354057 [Mycena pura]|uniref:Uncharacterized protein n=1 Tax=Mycena pura TaxID=153505 RepID=A0AAD6YK27_9AGAR|nr:hypothetical protein GGX14DRAFT_354057 [Mycena pura]